MYYVVNQLFRMGFINILPYFLGIGVPDADFQSHLNFGGIQVMVWNGKKAKVVHGSLRKIIKKGMG